MRIEELVAHGLPEECIPLFHARGYGELTTIQEMAAKAGVVRGHRRALRPQFSAMPTANETRTAMPKSGARFRFHA